ncbi:MAG: RICIN domain-containing protein [Alphaproteobacteria bacterium]|nr:RICIN domain-containing protein [Alphaproteobacteria bacterium]
MRAIFASLAIAGALSAAAQADEAWRSDIGDIHYMGEFGAVAVLINYDDPRGIQHFYVERLAGNYEERSGVFSGYWFLDTSQAPKTAGGACSQVQTGPDGLRSSHWGRFELEFDGPVWGEGFSMMMGNCEGMLRTQVRAEVGAEQGHEITERDRFYWPSDYQAGDRQLTGVYRLQTQFGGPNRCLEGNQASASQYSGAAFMDVCQNVTGQRWRFVPANDGYFRLQNEFRGEGECLESNERSSGYHGGAAFMDSCQNVSGQLWRVEPIAGGLVRLHSMWRGDDECLESMNPASQGHNVPAFMDSCQNVTGQFWRLVRIAD